MKRRTGNIDTGKPPRRPLKSRPSKFGDSIFGSSFIYAKYVIIWFLILIVDFILEFRFEYMWPFWLLIQAVYDTFKCQGLAYSVFFVCIAITSDTICLLFIPIQWLLFLASTYVWIHYVWHTDKGICLPTVVMWLFFMYIEVYMRQHDVKNYSDSSSIGLCKPFAAHCIGHPVVTFGVGVKTYISYRMRLRTQKCVQKENEFYYELLKQSLPKPIHTNNTLAITEKEKHDASSVSNGSVPSLSSNHSNNKKSEKSSKGEKSTFHDKESMQIAESSASSSTTHTSSRSTSSNSTSSRTVTSSSSSSRSKSSHTVTSSTRSGSTSSVTTSSSNDSGGSGKSRRHKNRDNSSNHDSSNSPSTSTRKSSSSSPKLSHKNHKQQQVSSSSSSSGDAGGSNNSKTVNNSSSSVVPTTNNIPNGHVVTTAAADSTTATNNNNKIELVCTANVIEQLEATIAKLKGELRSAQKSDNENKAKVDAFISTEKSLRAEVFQLQKENETLQTKHQTLFSGKLKDKQNMQSMEKRLKLETENRSSAEKLLQEVKRKRKEDEESASRAAAAQTSKDKETFEMLRKSHKGLENDKSKLQKDLQQRDEKMKELEKTIAELQQYEKSNKESGTLMSALEAMQEKNVMLENSLSAETKLKLDLFSALGDVKRQLALSNAAILQRDSEITGLKQRMTEFLSVMPNQRMRNQPTPHYSTNFLEKSVEFSSPPPPPFSPCMPPRVTSADPSIRPVSHPIADQQNMMGAHIHPMTLDPNAAAIIYNPNTSM